MHATGSRETTRQEVDNTRGSSPRPAVGNRKLGRRDKEKASSSGPKVRVQTDGKRARSKEAGLSTRAKIPCLWMARCRKSSNDYRHPPVGRKKRALKEQL